MRKLWLILVGLLLLGIPHRIIAAEKKLTIIHTNDMHSHFLGGPANMDYTPQTTGDDQTIGGWARIAAVLKTTRQSRDNPVLVVDAGDFLMGSLFHMLSREQAFELRLLHAMGYDAVTLGNHEFDLKPRGLARILTAARDYGEIPPLVLSNAIFSPDSDADDSLEKLFGQGTVKPYRVVEKEGIRIGIFGLMGKDAAEKAPFASPVRFGDPVQTARTMVKTLREKENVSVVVCLSHSGLSSVKKRSADEALARSVDGIDIIVGGHSHTRIDGVLQVNDTLIVQAWEYGKQVGVLDVVLSEGRVSLKDYRLVAIDDAIPADDGILHRIEAFTAEISAKVLSPEKLSFKSVIAETDFDLCIETDESNLGNMIADALRWYIHRHGDGGKVDVAVNSNGVIRDPILRGKTGEIAACDAFRAIPLGIGFDEAETMGYPLICVYLYPSELKKALEVLTSIYPLKGDDYFLQVSGVRFRYNPNRMIFDRVTDIWLGDEEEGYRQLDYSRSNRTLLRVAADIFNATFLKIVGNFTWHILDIVPKDAGGNPIRDLKTARIDADKEKEGIQELKEWKAVMEYIRSFPDSDGDGVPNVPEKYRGKLGRNRIEASWNPYKLLKRGTYVTWSAFLVFLLGLLFIAGVARFLVRRRS